MNVSDLIRIIELGVQSDIKPEAMLCTMNAETLKSLLVSTSGEYGVSENGTRLKTPVGIVRIGVEESMPNGQMTISVSAYLDGSQP